MSAVTSYHVFCLDYLGSLCPCAVFAKQIILIVFCKVTTKETIGHACTSLSRSRLIIVQIPDLDFDWVGILTV